MRKQDVIKLSPLFEPRVSPAETLGKAHRKSAFFDGVSGDDYALYWACRGPASMPVRDVAAAAGLRSERLHKICAESNYDWISTFCGSARNGRIRLCRMPLDFALTVTS